MSEPHLKVVGEIKSPAYKDPVCMLRNLADDVEAGIFGEIGCIAIATFGAAGLNVFAGGKDSDGAVVAMVLQSASMKMCQPLLDYESDE